MKTRTFYLLDLDAHSPEDFAAQAVEVDGICESDAATTWGCKMFDDMEDGRSTRCMVADNPAGEDAFIYTVTQHVEVRYEASEEA